MDCTKLESNGARFSYLKNDIPNESLQFSLDDEEEFSTTKLTKKSIRRELLPGDFITTTTSSTTQNHCYTPIALSETKKPTNRNTTIVNGTKNEHLSLVNNENNTNNEAHFRVFPTIKKNGSSGANFREESRLTDEIELDGDSGSDDGLILPTLSSNHSNNSHSLTQTINNKLLSGIRRLKRLFFCCTPHWIPPKFSFLRSNI